MIRAVATQSEAFDLETAQCFLQRFLERAPDRHRLADTLHPRRQRCVRLRKFLERETRDLYDAIINGWLEAGWRFARDVVFNFIECVTDGEFGRDFCNREAGCL